MSLPLILLLSLVAQVAPTPVEMGASVAPLVDRVKGSVVTIQSTKVIPRVVSEDPAMQYFRERFGLGQAPMRKETQRGLGSGFVINKAGIILTNNHVVAGADEVWVQLPDERRFEARVVGSDPSTDVAVIKLNHPPGDLRPVQIGNSEQVRVGDYVLAIGNPLGLGQTVTMGIVSAKNRAIGEKLGDLDPRYQDFIQTDAAINLGRQIADQIRQNGTVARGYLGVGGEDFTPERAAELHVPFMAGALVNVV